MFVKKFFLLCVVLFVSFEMFSQAEFVRLCTLPNLRGRCVNVVANMNRCRNVPGRPQVYRSLLIESNTNVGTWSGLACRGQRALFRGSSEDNRRLNIRPRVIRSVRITCLFRNGPPNTTPVEKKEKDVNISPQSGAADKKEQEDTNTPNTTPVEKKEKEVNIPPQSGAADKKEQEDINTPNAPSTPQAVSVGDIDSAILQN
jgi:hypothetical protein